MDNRNKAYAAVPLQVDNENNSPITFEIRSNRSIWRCLIFTVSTIFTLGVLAKARRLGTMSPKSKTLLPGGGRDWTLNLEEGTISPKHDPEFALGTMKIPPLVLTPKDAYNAIKFDKETLTALSNGEPQELVGIGLASSKAHDFEDKIEFKFAGTTPEISAKISYKDSNFLVLDESPELVLDISFWKYEPGNTVNFVRSKSESILKTFQAGGGRDWILDFESGCISPKHAPMLALGRGFQSLQLHKRGSEGVWKFDDLQKLKDGKVMKFINSEGAAMGKQKDKESFYDEWRYIQSSQVKDPSEAISVKYIDDNYIAVYEESIPQERSLVFDVAFWKMFEFNKVNYVGGWSWDGKSNLREIAHGHKDD